MITGVGQGRLSVARISPALPASPSRPPEKNEREPPPPPHRGGCGMHLDGAMR
jgi:hypothetical protein